MSVEHGTPQGYRDGCRGPNCAHHGTKLMTCTEASIRYAGDYAYRKQVDAGTATSEKEIFAKPVKVKPVKPPVVKPPKVPKPKPEPKPRPIRPVKVKGPRKPRVLVEKPNGTTHAQMRACQTDCPNEEPCTVKRRRLQEAQLAATRARPIPADKHGTITGYTYGCHKESPCPGSATGETCTQAAARYQLAATHRRRENKAASVNSAGAVSMSTEGTA